LRSEALHLLGQWYTRYAQLHTLQCSPYLHHPLVAVSDSTSTQARIATLRVAVNTLERAVNLCALNKEEEERKERSGDTIFMSRRDVMRLNLARARTLLVLSGDHSHAAAALSEWHTLESQLPLPPPPPLHVASQYRLRSALALAATHFATHQFDAVVTTLRTLSQDSELCTRCVDLLVLCPLWLAKAMYFTRAPLSAVRPLFTQWCVSSFSFPPLPHHISHFTSSPPPPHTSSPTSFSYMVSIGDAVVMISYSLFVVCMCVCMYV
jgi:hypothetical protein